jgi:hypothetical protein
MSKAHLEERFALDSKNAWKLRQHQIGLREIVGTPNAKFETVGFIDTIYINFGIFVWLDAKPFRQIRKWLCEKGGHTICVLRWQASRQYLKYRLSISDKNTCEAWWKSCMSRSPTPRVVAQDFAHPPPTK